MSNFSPRGLERWLVGGLALVACSRPPAEDHAATTGDPPPHGVARQEAQDLPTRQERVRATGQLGPGAGTLVVSLAAPRGGKLTEKAPIVLEGKGPHVRFLEKISAPLQVSQLPLRIPIEVLDGATEPAKLNLKYYWCREGDDAACFPERVELSVDFDFSGTGPGGEAHFSHTPRT